MFHHHAHEGDAAIDRKTAEVQMTLAALRSDTVCTSPKEATNCVLAPTVAVDISRISEAA